MVLDDGSTTVLDERCASPVENRRARTFVENPREEPLWRTVVENPR
jgi:hypothetical protein